MTKRIFYITIFLFINISLNAQHINARIFADRSIKEVLVTPSFGRYTLTLDNNQKIKLSKTSKVKIKSQGDKVKVTLGDSVCGEFKKVIFLSEGLKCFFQIEPDGKIAKRRYDDNLIIISDGKGGLKIINDVETESYIAGVVQSETWGATKNVDFFKVQAICARNYLMMNLGKHKKDGHHVCDGVHCQAYYGRANQVEVIEGAYNSKGELIVDKDGNLIETLFHSNSGGQTVNAEDVWGKPFSHLVSKADTFSIGTKAYAWEKFIPMKTWTNYFKDKGLKIKDDSIKNEILNFSQKEGRKKEMLGIPLVQIRKDFNLRSTLFSVQEWGSEVKLMGNGYGHGVGMSQEGAIKMCDEGYEYWEILEHYYTGSKIKKIDQDKILNNEEYK